MSITPDCCSNIEMSSPRSSSRSWGHHPLDGQLMPSTRGRVALSEETDATGRNIIRNICIELHGKGCEEVFFAALKDFDYKLGHSGELAICRN